MKTIIIQGFGLALMASAALARPADDQAILNYILTMDKVTRYDDGARALEAAMNKDPAMKAQRQKMSREFSPTIKALEARFDRYPRILEFFTKVGLTKEDAALIPVVLNNACLSPELPPQLAKTMVYSEAQAQFCKTNNAALHKLRIFAPVKPGSTKK